MFKIHASFNALALALALTPDGRSAGYQSGQDVVDSSPLAAISRRTSTPARITQTPQEEIQSPRHDELRRLYATASPIMPQIMTPWGEL